MANHKSALKRAKQNENRRLRNRSAKTRIKNVVKQLMSAVEEKSADKAKSVINSAQSIIDRAAKKGIIHKNTASRKISRLSKQINKMSA